MNLGFISVGTCFVVGDCGGDVSTLDEGGVVAFGYIYVEEYRLFCLK
ncbi:hypothetical protein INO99_06990 [Staphylococcus aureus]|nr:hypothetical protein [Staphylococcus aureus]